MYQVPSFMLLFPLDVVQVSRWRLFITQTLFFRTPHSLIFGRISISIEPIARQHDFRRAEHSAESGIFFSLFPSACCQRVNNSGPMNRESKAVPTAWLVLFIIQQRRTFSLYPYPAVHRAIPGRRRRGPTFKMREQMTMHLFH